MSQIFVPTSGGGGGGGAGTITGNTGGPISQSGGNWNIVAGTRAGASVTFSGSGSTLTLNLSNNSQNVFLGSGSGVLLGAATQSVGIGVGTLNSSTSSNQNVAIGLNVLNQLITGSSNVGIGGGALFLGTNLDDNTAIGTSSLQNCAGSSNSAVGINSLISVTTGTGNSAFGADAGSAYVSSESNNISINNNGVVGDSGVIRIGRAAGGGLGVSQCFIAGITGVAIIAGAAVLCDANGQLGTVVSSLKFKENVKKVTGSIMNLNPVSFNHKSDNTQTVSFGFIAEEVDKEFPELCLYDNDKKPFSVKYHEMPALLLKEIQRLNDRISTLEKVKVK